MTKKVLIIGAVALGPKVASRLSRLDPEADITIIDRDSLISYGGCGIPYFVGGDIADVEALYSTTAHAIRDPEFFRTVKGVNVKARTEAVAIDRRAKTVKVKNLDTGAEEDLPYDKLVIGSGASPMLPPIPGADLPGVHTVSNIHSAKAIKDMIAKGSVETAVVVGAGAIGIEMAEALTDLWGVETHLVEMADQVLPMALSRDMGYMTKKQLEKNDVSVRVSTQVTKILGDPETGVTGIEMGDETIDCDLVILSVGVRPNTKFAAEAGLAVGRSGALIVDETLKTTDPDIYAGGDCIEMRNIVSGASTTMPLGSLANRQGRIIASNIFGQAAQFKGTVGTFCIKIFDVGVATAGLNMFQAKQAGFDPVQSTVAQFDRAHFYPDSKFMYIQLIADRASRKILGVEAYGYQIDAVKARVDAVASLLQAGCASIDDICTLEVGYAPPFASAMDTINNAGNTLDNILRGVNTSVDILDFLPLFKDGKAKVLDLREASEAAPFIETYGADKWLHIRQPELRDKYESLSKDEEIYLFCGTGARSYECQTFLKQVGFENTYNIQGGYALMAVIEPEFIPSGA